MMNQTTIKNFKRDYHRCERYNLHVQVPHLGRQADYYKDKYERLNTGLPLSGVMCVLSLEIPKVTLTNQGTDCSKQRIGYQLLIQNLTPIDIQFTGNHGVTAPSILFTFIKLHLYYNQMAVSHMRLNRYVYT